MTIVLYPVIDNWTYELDMPGEIYDPIELEEDQPTNAEIIKTLSLGKMKWTAARAQFSFLAKAIDKESVKLWKAICDSAHMQDLMTFIRNKSDIGYIPDPSEMSDKEIDMTIKRVRKILPDAPKEQDEFFAFIDDYNEHWVDIYRKSYQRLERIVETYTTNPTYIPLDKMFNISGTARYLSNELLLNQTQPIAEARIHTDIDAYTGIHYERDPEYITIPDRVTLENDGEPITIELGDIGSWGGTFTDHDHEWDDEREITSSSIKQMMEQEYKVTNAYYDLRRRLDPAIRELERLGNEQKPQHIEEHNAKQEAKRRILEYIDDQDFVRKFEKQNIKRTRKDYTDYPVQYSLLLGSLRKSLRMEHQAGTPVQDIAAIAMELPDMSICSQVDSVIDQFGDEILDQIATAPGITAKPDEAWEHDIEALHRQTLDQFEAVANNFSPKHSAVFTKEVFKAIAEDHLPISQATSTGYESFREISPAGSSAYRQAVIDGSSPREAMKAFYKAAAKAGEFVPKDRLSGADNQGMKLLTASSGYTQKRFVVWGLARHKAKAGEIYVPKQAPQESKNWLFAKLKSLRWPDDLIASLAE